MNFETFLKESSKKSFWEKEKNICFIGKKYPLIFSKYLFSFLKENQLLEKPTTIFLDDLSPLQINSLLNQSFLGNKAIYCLGELKNSRDKKGNEIVENIISYTGLHKLIFFINKENKLVDKIKKQIKTIDYINLEEEIDQRVFNKFLNFLNKSHLIAKRSLIDNVFRKSMTVSTDEACRVIDYLELVNLNSAQKFNQYLSFILESEKSFFSLSNFFFARNKEKFFNLWEEIGDDFSVLFWISYWSDQIWRAHYVSKYLIAGDSFQARKMSVRLPFSFIKTYWRNFSPDELIKEYNFLYKADFLLKTGSTFPLMDLFYSKHFSKEFSK
ncbi:hypothetical protein KAW80_00185 [Candidatus Babeliales bacterium]|nr:hypothetical protein [Candidatus Babeliales bacterium]